MAGWHGESIGPSQLSVHDEYHDGYISRGACVRATPGYEMGDTRSTKSPSDCVRLHSACRLHE